MAATADFVAGLEKVELHCHVDGLLDPPMLDALAARGIELPVSREALAGAWPVSSYQGWIGGYMPVVEPGLRDKERGVLPVLLEHVRRLKAQSVTYAEIMLNGLLMADPDLGRVVEIFRIFRRLVDEESDPGLRVGFVVAIGRGPVAKIERQAERILAIRRAGLISGFALAGDERACTVASIAPIIRRLRDAGLGIEIHAGEFAGAESVRDALIYGIPDRLGHGVAAFMAPDLVEEIRQRNIHVEFCLTSNLRLGVVPAIADHPAGRAHELGVAFSLNTDDPGPFGCSMDSEFALAASTWGWGDEVFDRIRRDSVAAGFSYR